MPVILIDPCKDERWDAFVEAHPFGWVCHLSAWKRVLESSFPHMRGHYLALVDENGRIQAGLPLFEVRSRLLGNRLVSIPFATLCDPLVSNREQLAVLLQVAKGLMSGLGTGHLEMRAHHLTQFLRGRAIHQRLHYKCHFLDLTLPLERLFATFHRHAVRYMIRKAGRFPFSFSVTQDVADLETFYGLYVSTRKRLGLPPQPFKFFLELWRHLGPGGVVLFVLARLDGKAVGGLMLLCYKDRVSAEANGLDESESRKGTQFFLFWEAVKMAHAQGLKVFDFGRTAVENQGLMTFKRRWGTQEEDLPQFFLYNGSGPRKNSLSDMASTKLRWLCSRLPSTLFVALGRACYRHMG